MNKALPPGQFYGKTLNQREVAEFCLSESIYSPDTRIAKHSHENSYFSILLQGTYTERYGNKTRDCKASTVVFHPPQELHEDHFLKEGGRLFRFEIKRQWLERVQEHTRVLFDPAHFNGGSLAWFAIRLYQEFQQLDGVSPLAIEGLVLEIVAEFSRKSSSLSEIRPPRWLEKAREILHAQFSENLVFTSIADLLGVHPVHFARAFRKYHGCTVGEYVRLLRIESASRLLTATDNSIADIAVACGFSDQSHFSKAFKHATGMTPAQFRTVTRAR